MLRIVVDYCNGAAQQQIAARHGVHVQTIRKILRDNGVSVRDHRAVLTQDDIRMTRDQGASARQLSRRYGVAHTTILRHLN